MQKEFDVEQAHDNFVKRYFVSQRKETTEELRQRNAGCTPIPKSERRGNNKVAVYLNDEEMKTVQEFVGERRISDVIRNLVLEGVRSKE